MKRVCFANICLIIAILFIIIFIYTPSKGLSSDPKSYNLHKKTTQMILLREQLIKIKTEVINLKESLAKEIQNLKKEIIHEHNHLKIRSYEEAIGVPRVFYNIKLIQELYSYVNGLDKRALFITNGIHEIDFVLAQSKDDLKILENISDMEINKLLIQMEDLSIQYNPDVKKLLLDKIEKKLISPQKIYSKTFE